MQLPGPVCPTLPHPAGAAVTAVGVTALASLQAHAHLRVPQANMVVGAPPPANLGAAKIMRRVQNWPNIV